MLRDFELESLEMSRDLRVIRLLHVVANGMTLVSVDTI